MAHDSSLQAPLLGGHPCQSKLKRFTAAWQRAWSRGEHSSPSASPSLSSSSSRPSCCLFSAMAAACAFCKRQLVSPLWAAVRSEPAKTIHGLKVGFALALAFLLVLLDVSYEQLGTHAIWAIMTVIVVFEFSMGATLSKGCNRGIGTLLAGLMAIAIGQLAQLAGDVGHPIVIGLCVFVTGGLVTFFKLQPTLKTYEFGFRTFLITFCLIVVVGYQGSDPLGTAIERFLVILLGACIGIAVNIFILPNWAGEDLHRSITKNFYSIADSLELCVNQYLHGKTLERVPSKILMGLAPDDPVYKGYGTTLVSSNKEESLAGFASWELFPHGPFKWKHPWKQYVKIGAVLRHCAYSVVALHGCLRSGIQAPAEVRRLFETELRQVSTESALVLRRLGMQFENMQKGDPDNILKGVLRAVECLQQSLYLHSYLLLQGRTEVLEESAEDASVHVMLDIDKPGPINAFDNQTTSNLGIVTYTPTDANDLSNRYMKKLRSWPCRPIDDVDFTNQSVYEQRVRVLESASALSLGTFATLLMEVALRLDYVVEAVVELGELANFK